MATKTMVVVFVHSRKHLDVGFGVRLCSTANFKVG